MKERERKIFDAITDLPDEMIEEAGKGSAGRNYAGKRGHGWKKYAALAACAVLVIGVAGSSLYYSGRGGSKEGALLEITFPKAYAFEDYDARREIRDANPVEESFLEAVNEFTWQTASEFLSAEGGNLNYSPLSLYYALALAASGAGGDTAEELFGLLGAADQEQLSEQCGNLYRRLYLDNEVGKLRIGNSLWLSNEVDFKNSFVKNAAENFYTSSFHVDFTDERTGRGMAEWIADNTKGTLQPEMKMDAGQVMMILNTVYFKDEWADRFSTLKTKKDTFYLSDGSTVECDFMNRTQSSAGFVKTEGFTSARLYLKNAGSMIFILPDEGISPQELVSTPDKVREIFQTEQTGFGEIVWKVPKFSFDSELNLSEGLKNLGVKAAFEETADFSGITDEIAFLSDVHQETRISIDEKGVEASAFTEIAYVGAGMIQDRAEMILDRPFIYGIFADNGTLLFIGICEDPS